MYTNANELVSVEEVAIILFSRGEYFTFSQDGEGFIGNYFISSEKTKKLEKIVIYFRNINNGCNEIYLGTFERWERKDLHGRKIIYFSNLQYLGDTKSNWIEFAGGSGNPVFYIYKSPREGYLKALNLVQRIAFEALREYKKSTAKDELFTKALVILFNQILEISIALKFCIRERLILSAGPLLRSIWEGLLSINYILEKPKKIHQRSLIWFYHASKQHLVVIHSYTNKGQWTKIKKSIHSSISQDFPDLTKQRENANRIEKEIISIIDRKDFDFIRDESDEQYFFSYFSSIRNWDQLAEKFSLHGLTYLLPYRSWRNIAHSVDYLSFVHWYTDIDYRKYPYLPISYREIASFGVHMIIEVLFLLVSTSQIDQKWKSELLKQEPIIKELVVDN